MQVELAPELIVVGAHCSEVTVGSVLPDPVVLTGVAMSRRISAADNARGVDAEIVEHRRSK